MAVYFLQEAIENPTAIKIGSGNDPMSRKESLEAGNPIKLKLLAVMRGSIKEEKALHKRFAELRLHREWFRYEDPLRCFVESLRLSTTLQDELELLHPKKSNKGSIKITPKRININNQRDLVLKAIKKHPNDSKRQIAYTKLKKSTFYVRKAELVEMKKLPS